MNTKITNKEKHLILLDIDGTSTNPDFATLNPRLKNLLQKLITEEGHLVCFLTGRNWLSAFYFWKEAGLNTFLVAYNGAFISNPTSKNEEIVVINPIANQVVKNILNEPLIKKNLRNVLIDKIDRTVISTS